LRSKRSNTVLTEEKAVKIITRNWRSYKEGGNTFVAVVNGMWEAVWDEKYNRHYYQHKVTGESTWEKPDNLQNQLHKKDEKGGKKIAKKEEGKIRKKKMTRVAAAGVIQNNYRNHSLKDKGKSTVKKVVWRKVWDIRYGRHYYENTKTGTSVWEKPSDFHE
jgi:hypothetical protein